MADNVAITAGAGTTIATDDVGGFHYQRVKVAFGTDGVATDVHGDNPFPVIQRGIPTYFYSTAMNAGAASKIYIDIFNATGSGKVLKLRGLYVVSNSAVVTGVPVQWTLARTTAVGSSATSTLTAGVADLSDPAVPAQVTARDRPTAGATTGGALFDFWTTSEETLPANALGSITNWCITAAGVTPITVRENQGVKLTHVTSTTAGSWMVTAAVTLE